MEMKIIEVEINENSGNCFGCQGFFDDFKYFFNIKFKYCSIRCYLKNYSNDELKIIWDVVIPDIDKPKTRWRGIKKLSEEMVVRGW